VAERAEHAAAMRLDGVVGVNEDLAARFAYGGQRTVAVTNAPWGEGFPVPPPSDEPIVLYVGGLGEARGLQVMKDAFALVTHPGAKLLLVGPGDPGELAPNVECLGVVDHSEVAALLARCQVSWVPVQRHGNYAKAVLTKLVEAMASARPIVVSDFGRIAHIVRTTGCGIPVEADNPKAHAQAIDMLLGDPELATRMGQAGRTTFEAGWAFEQQADRLTSFYETLLRHGA
jgi:glycosyltransferase involved in cell wall biosynthesis